MDANKRKLLCESDFNITTLLSRIPNNIGISKELIMKIIRTLHSIISVKLPGRETEDYIYYVLEPRSSIKEVYLVHIDPLLFRSGWTHSDIQNYLIGTNHVLCIRGMVKRPCPSIIFKGASPNEHYSISRSIRAAAW